jgi:hypothetical protein
MHNFYPKLTFAACVAAEAACRGNFDDAITTLNHCHDMTIVMLAHDVRSRPDLMKLVDALHWINMTRSLYRDAQRSAQELIEDEADVIEISLHM